jgi:hypothetical protein
MGRVAIAAMGKRDYTAYQVVEADGLTTRNRVELHDRNENDYRGDVVAAGVLRYLIGGEGSR